LFIIIITVFRKD